MKKVRKGIFETNSSSSHSLSIGVLLEGDADVDESNDDKIVLGNGKFGWEWEDYDSWLDKADYLALLMGNYNFGDINNLLNAIHRKYPNATIIISNNGYIDHGSDYWEEWMNNEDDIFTFLFGNGGISTGNDNCEPKSQAY